VKKQWVAAFIVGSFLIGLVLGWRIQQERSEKHQALVAVSTRLRLPASAPASLVQRMLAEATLRAKCSKCGWPAQWVRPLSVSTPPPNQIFLCQN
jgi:hypothetical protein